jgi:DNA-binding MarR family transcriptional regulator
MDHAPARLRSKPTWLINKISQHAHRLRSERLAALDARAHEFAVLAALQEFGAASQMAIGQRCGIDRSDTHATVADLVDQAFVERAPDPADRRRNIITITPAGERRLETVDAALTTVQDALLAALSPAERRQLVDLLVRVLDGNN